MSGNVLVEQLSNGSMRETPFNAPAVENTNSRLEQVGPFRQDNPPAAQAATAQTLGATDASAPTEFIASRPGKIVGITTRSNADLTAGTATAQATVNGTASGDTAVLSDLVQQKVTTLSAPVAFVAGDRLGVKLATSAGYLPVTADIQSYLLVRWDAQ